MDYTLPVAKRTRLREAEMYRKCHEEIKNKRRQEKKGNGTESTSGVGPSGVKGKTFHGSSKKGSGSKNLCFGGCGDMEGNELGGAFGFDSVGFESYGCGDFDGFSNVSPIVLDDDENEVVFEGETEQDNEDKEVIFINDDDNDEENAVGVNGSEMGETNGLNSGLKHSGEWSGGVGISPCRTGDESIGGLKLKGDKDWDVEFWSITMVNEIGVGDCDERKSSAVAGRARLQSRLNEKSNDDDGSDNDFVEISEDDLMELDVSSSEDDEEDNDDITFSSEDSDEDNDDPDDEDYRVDQSESSINADELSSEEDKDDGDGKGMKGIPVERETGKRGNKNKVGIEFKSKKVSGIEILSDSCDSKNDDKNDQDDSLSRGQKPVAKRTKSCYTPECGNKQIKLGTVSHPLCADEEELEDLCDDIDINEAPENSQTSRPKKGEIRSKEPNGDDIDNCDEPVQDLCGGKPQKRKCIRAFKDHDIVKILVESILDKAEVPLEEENEPVIEPTLPLKFTFGAEETTPAEKSKEDRELEELWAELGLGLCQNDDTDKAMVESETDVFSEAEPDMEALCRQGYHQFILDEEIGIKCKFCSFVDVEIKYYVPPFGTNPWGKSERRDSSTIEHNIFDELCHHDSGYDSQRGCDPSAHVQGTAWDIIPGIVKDMHPHQREGFEFLWTNIAGGIYLDKLKEPSGFNAGSGCVISHAPGTGKTRLAIVFLQTYLKLYPNCMPVIIAPCSMLLTWEAEFQKWKVDIPFHNLNTVELSGKENKVAIGFLRRARSRHHSARAMRMVKLYSWKKGGSILGISYRLFEELVREGSNKKSKEWHKNEDDQVRKILLELPGLLVLDEGHTPRNDHSYIFQALSKIQTEKRIILSGTPFQNNFDELFNTLCLVRPQFGEKISSKRYGALPRQRSCKRSEARGRWAFLTSSIGKVTDSRLKAKRLEEVRAIIQPFVHVHRGSILQERLPGLRDSVVILQPFCLQKSLLDGVQLLSSHCNFNLEFSVSVVSVHPSLLSKKNLKTEELVVDWGKLEKLRLNPEAGVKTKFLMELIRLSNARYEKVLVFSQFHCPLNLIQEQLESQFNWSRGRDVLFMHGKLNIDERQSLMKDFNDPNSEAKVMLASTKACSEGINLAGASRVVLLDVVWNPSVERQAISRAYRLGQQKVVHIYHLITSGTLEEEKYCRQAEKERLSELVFYSTDGAGGHQKFSSNLSDDKKDLILEEMVERDKLKDMFKKIIYQPKDSNLVESFGLVDVQ